MTLRDDYLDALALMQARVSKDAQAADTIAANTDPVGLVNALVTICINVGSANTSTPDDPTIFFAQLREQIEQHEDLTDE